LSLLSPADTGLGAVRMGPAFPHGPGVRFV